MYTDIPYLDPTRKRVQWVTLFPFERLLQTFTLPLLDLFKTFKSKFGLLGKKKKDVKKGTDLKDP